MKAVTCTQYCGLCTSIMQLNTLTVYLERKVDLCFQRRLRTVEISRQIAEYNNGINWIQYIRDNTLNTIHWQMLQYTLDMYLVPKYKGDTGTSTTPWLQYYAGTRGATRYGVCVVKYNRLWHFTSHSILSLHITRVIQPYYNGHVERDHCAHILQAIIETALYRREVDNMKM